MARRRKSPVLALLSGQTFLLEIEQVSLESGYRTPSAINIPGFLSFRRAQRFYQYWLQTTHSVYPAETTSCRYCRNWFCGYIYKQNGSYRYVSSYIPRVILSRPIIGPRPAPCLQYDWTTYSSAREALERSVEECLQSFQLLREGQM